MLWVTEDNEAVVYIAAVNYGFEMGRAVIKPFLFMMGEENVGKGGAEGGSHGHTISLAVELSFEDKYSVLGG